MLNRTLLTAFAVIGLSAASMAQVIVNGDFEAGNTGFSSDYGYVPVVDQSSLYPEGIYTVDDNPNDGHNLFTSMGDHTTGTGNMLIANGQNGTHAVWSQTVTGLTAGTYYNLSAWASSVHPTAPANLSFFVDGVQLSPNLQLTSTTNLWEELKTTFLATDGDALVEIINAVPDLNGNDYALDDITIDAVPEPGTMTALGLGIAALLRRRNKKA
jgi:hypothetical protein